MEAKDYLKNKKIWLGTKVADMNAPENYFELEHLLEDYHQSKLKLFAIPAVTNSASYQAEIVKQRLHYHFAKTDGTWDIPKDMPFMKEFLNEVNKLCDLAS